MAITDISFIVTTCGSNSGCQYTPDITWNCFAGINGCCIIWFGFQNDQIIDQISNTPCNDTYQFETNRESSTDTTATTTTTTTVEPDNSTQTPMAVTSGTTEVATTRSIFHPTLYYVTRFDDIALPVAIGICHAVFDNNSSSWYTLEALRSCC